jgi:hypothetical protein
MDKKSKIIASIGIAAGAVLAFVLLRKAKAAPPPPPPPGYANLYGVVTDALTGSSLIGVLVSLGAVAPIPGEPELWQVYTDSGGNFIFTDLQPGEYVLQFSKTGYQTLIK